MGHLIVELRGIAADATEADIRQFLMPDRERWHITVMKFDPANERVVMRFWNNTHAAACIMEFKKKGYDIGWAASGRDLAPSPAARSSRPSPPARRDVQQPAKSVFISGLPRRTAASWIRRFLAGFGPIGDVRMIADGARAFVDFEDEADAIRCIAELPRTTLYQARWADNPTRKSRRSDRDAAPRRPQGIKTFDPSTLKCDTREPLLLTPAEIAARNRASRGRDMDMVQGLTERIDNWGFGSDMVPDGFAPVAIQNADGEKFEDRNDVHGASRNSNVSLEKNPREMSPEEDEQPKFKYDMYDDNHMTIKGNRGMVGQDHMKNLGESSPSRTAEELGLWAFLKELDDMVKETDESKQRVTECESVVEIEEHHRDEHPPTTEIATGTRDNVAQNMMALHRMREHIDALTEHITTAQPNLAFVREHVLQMDKLLALHGV